MGTPFTEIYVQFLAQVKTHELASMPETSLEENMQLWLLNSLGYFTMCRKELSYDLQLSEFEEELDNNEKAILASYMTIEYLNTFLMKAAGKLEELLPKLPNGMRSTLATKARELIDEGQLDSLNKIRAIEKALGVDLESFATKG